MRAATATTAAASAGRRNRGRSNGSGEASASSARRATVAPGRGPRRGRGREAVARGQKFSRDDFEMERQIGEGSFGVVYEGRVKTTNARGLREGDAVVMKRPKLTVEGAAELQEIESWMNDRVTRDAKGACAEYAGSFRVTRDDWLASSTSDILSKEGLWLVWKYQGDRTLAQYLAQPDYPTGLAKALLNKKDVIRGNAAVELEITQKAIAQLLKSLQAIHRAGLVHRDVKPHNLVLAREPEPEFKVIDLGACACFRTGTNFTPDETIMDPKYAPPEEFLIPTDDAPDLKKMFGPIALAAGTSAWLAHRPDRFDMYSAGIVLMQLAMPSLRTNSGLQGFNRGLKKYKYDLYRWRDANKGQLSRSKTAVLDAGDGAGWELAAELLRPRPYEAEDAEEARERLSAEEALKHRFFEVDPTELEVEVRDNASDNWMAETAGMLSDMFSLEKRIERQQANIAKQSTSIQRLKDDGADARDIAEEEKTLEKMRVGLQGLVRSMSFKEVEARTTMVTAATELKKAANNSGVQTSEEYDGLISDLSSSEKKPVRFGANIQKRAGEAATVTRKRVDEGVSSILRMLGVNRNTNEQKAPKEEETTAAKAAVESKPEKLEQPTETKMRPKKKETQDDDPEAIRLRMEAIQNEMNAVIEEMAEMESRLLAQQQQLETQQRNLASIIPESDSSSRKARTNGAKNGGANGASANGKNGGANGASANGKNGGANGASANGKNGGANGASANGKNGGANGASANGKNGGANGASANGKNGANGSAEAEMRDADLVDK